MRLRRQGRRNGPETGEKPTSKLSGVPPLTHDPDDRPTREDREGHGSPFDPSAAAAHPAAAWPSEEAGLRPERRLARHAFTPVRNSV